MAVAVGSPRVASRGCHGSPLSPCCLGVRLAHSHHRLCPSRAHTWCVSTFKYARCRSGESVAAWVAVWGGVGAYPPTPRGVVCIQLRYCVSYGRWGGRERAEPVHMHLDPTRGSYGALLAVSAHVPEPNPGWRGWAVWPQPPVGLMGNHGGTLPNGVGTPPSPPARHLLLTYGLL